MGAKDKDRERDYSPNPDFNRPRWRKESLGEQMAADSAWCKAAGTPEMMYELYPFTRPPEPQKRSRGRGER
jgi:hypothetical protein